MTLRHHRNEHLQAALSGTTSHSAFSSPMPSHNGFSTRTRLRPGGPLATPTPTSSFDYPEKKNNSSLPSFEEIGMKTLAASNHHHQQPSGQFLLNRRPYFSTMMKNPHQPSTPLVKQKTAGCSSPRVQMYRTRVVYSDARDAIKAAQEAAV